MINIAVLVSGGGTNLQALIDAQGEVLQHGKIKLVISSKPDVYALHRAEKAGIEHCVIAKRDYTIQEEFSNALLQQLQSYQIDMIVLAGYLSILDETIIRAYPNRIINIHPSLIPSFCGDGFYGENVHKAVIKSGVKFTGATTHFVDENVDTGAIILQDVVPVFINDDFETVAKRVLEIEHEILVKTVKAFCDNKIVFKDNRAFIVEE